MNDIQCKAIMAAIIFATDERTDTFSSTLNIVEKLFNSALLNHGTSKPEDTESQELEY